MEREEFGSVGVAVSTTETVALPPPPQFTMQGPLGTPLQEDRSALDKMAKEKMTSWRFMPFMEYPTSQEFARPGAERGKGCGFPKIELIAKARNRGSGSGCGCSKANRSLRAGGLS